MDQDGTFALSEIERDRLRAVLMGPVEGETMRKALVQYKAMLLAQLYTAPIEQVPDIRARIGAVEDFVRRLYASAGLEMGAATDAYHLAAQEE